MEFYQQSIDLSDKEEDKATTYNNMATIYLDRGNTAKGIETFQKAVGISHRAGNYQKLALFQLNIGNAYRRAKEFAKAEENLTVSLEGAKKIGDRYLEAAGYMNFGWLKLDQGDIPGAQEWLAKGLRLFSEIGAKRDAQSVDTTLQALKGK